MSEYDRQRDIAAEGQRAALHHGSKTHTEYVHDMITKSPDRKTIDALVAVLEEAQMWIAKDSERGIVAWQQCDAALALARGGR